MIAKIKSFLITSYLIIKANWQLFVAAVCVGFVVGAFTIGPLAALIQYVKDVL